MEERVRTRVPELPSSVPSFGCSLPKRSSEPQVQRHNDETLEYLRSFGLFGLWQLWQSSGPSHLETFDPKPRLAEMHGEPMPKSFTQGQQIAQLQGKELRCFGPQHNFQHWGSSGQQISEMFPQIGSVADDICIVRSMWTEQINHDPAHTFLNTGAIVAGRPSMGSWILYGLGAETENLPGFVVMLSSGKGGQMQPIAARQWSAGQLPS